MSSFKNLTDEDDDDNEEEEEDFDEAGMIIPTYTFYYNVSII